MYSMFQIVSKHGKGGGSLSKRTFLNNVKFPEKFKTDAVEARLPLGR